VIEEAAPGLAAAAKALAVHAARAKADALVMGTHARGGIARFFLGSYAETLLAFATTPLVFIHPHARVAARTRKILFATDLSPASRKAFVSLCRFAAAAGASVEVLHAIETPRHWATTYGRLVVKDRAVTVGEYVEGLREAALKKLTEFVKPAKSLRVKASSRVEISSQKISGMVLRAAERGSADMIALAAQSSRLRAGLLGSVAREVLRGSSLPVWLQHAVL
jgi:nucleotide-binding universal stress UspA family protein